jgi:hypothetical protein
VPPIAGRPTVFLLQARPEAKATEAASNRRRRAAKSR